MGYDFGNIHGMTKADFQAAIEYYQNKIAQMEADDSINPGAKAWFLKRYNARLQTLERGFERLQEVINDLRSRTPSVYVNEATATINSLSGTTANDTTTFSTMRQSKAKYGWGQFFRALGGLVLPVVGTIPFIISAVKARRKYKAVQSAIARENIDMQNFANERRRSYDAALATNTPFTEQEMQELLANPTELQRLTNLTNPTNTTLNPAEKKILASKLAAVRAYAQKNGYTIGTGTPLDNARFNTSADKIRANPLAAGPVGASTDLKDAHDKIKTLEGLKTQAEALLAADPENDDLKTLVSTIESNVTTLKGQAETFITGGLTTLNTDLTAAITSSTDEADIRTSNTNLDNAYNNKNRFGGTSSMTVAEARAYAEALGLDVSGFDSSKQKYDNAKSKNTTDLQVYNDFDRIYAEAERIVNTYNVPGFITGLDSSSNTEAINQLNIAHGKLNQLQALLPNLPTGDSRKVNYQSLLADLNTCKDAANDKANNFEADEKGFSALESIYNAARALLTSAPPPDIYALKSHKENLKYVIDTIKDLPEPRVSKFNTLLSNSYTLDHEYDKRISSEEVKGTDYQVYETKINGITETSLSKLNENKAALISILNIIDKEEYKSKFNGVTRNKLDLLILKAKDKLEYIENELAKKADIKKANEDKKKDYLTYVNGYHELIENIETQYKESLKVLTGSYGAVQKENAKLSIEAMYNKLKELKSQINTDSSLKPEDKQELLRLVALNMKEFKKVYENAKTT